MRKSHGFTLIETLIGLTIIAVLAVGAYTVWQRPATDGPSSTPTTTPSTAATKALTSTSAPAQITEMTATPTSSATSWKTYENTHFGFSIQYPPTWNSRFTTKPDTHLFSYPEPTQGYDLLHYPPQGEMAIDVYAFAIPPAEASSAQTLHPLIEKYFPKAQRISESEESDPLISTDSAIIGHGSKLADNAYWSILGVTRKGRSVGFVLNKDKTTFVIFVAQPAPNEKIEGNNLSTFNQILSTFEFNSQLQSTEEPTRKINHTRIGGWVDFQSATGYSIQHPPAFYDTSGSGEKLNTADKCAMYFGNDAGGVFVSRVVLYDGGSRRKLYGVHPEQGYTYRFEDVIIQGKKSLVIETGPIGDSGSGTGVVIPVGNYALILSWSNRGMDTPDVNKLFRSVEIEDALDITKCGQ